MYRFHNQSKHLIKIYENKMKIMTTTCVRNRKESKNNVIKSFVKLFTKGKSYIKISMSSI